MAIIVIAVVAYLIGAIPTGLIVGRVSFNVDIRERGSGNIGFTNVRRAFGNKAGFLVLAIDMLKGAGVTMAVAWGAMGFLEWPPAPEQSAAVLIVTAATALIAGNIFPVYIGFKGGKGVGATTGVMLALVPVIVGLLLIVWFIVREVSGYVSLASIVISLLFPVLVRVVYPGNLPYLIFAVFAAGLVVVSHRANISRLVAGEELKIDRKKSKRNE